MKENKLLTFTKFLFALFAIGTALAFFIVFKDMEASFVLKFMAGYAFLAFFLVLYTPIVVIISARKFKWIEIRKGLLSFLILFASTAVITYGCTYVLRPEKLDLFSIVSTSLGLAFAVNFIDIIFAKNKENEIS